MSSSPTVQSAKRTRRNGRRRPYPGEPVWDLAYLYPSQGGWSVEAYLELPGDLLVEFSDGRRDRRRDLVTKRAHYAAAGIREYWIVDPEKATITVLRLEGDAYVEHGPFHQGEAAPALLPGFAAPVADVFAVAE